MLPSANEIRCFLEIANTSNITRAAVKLGVTQPSLSQSLKKLEDNIGEQLVIRSKNGVDLTTSGKTFLKHANRLLELWNDVKAETKKSVGEVKGNIKFGCHPSVGMYTLDSFLPQLVNGHTGLEFSLYHDLSRRVVEKVINYELDMGLVINPVKHPDLVMTKVLEDKVRVWHSSGDIPDVLICHPELIQTQDILKRLGKRKINPRRHITTDNLEIITKLAMKKAGYGIIPGRVVSFLDTKKTLLCLDDGPVFEDELFLVYRVENKNTESIKAIKKFILKSVGQQS